MLYARKAQLDSYSLKEHREDIMTAIKTVAALWG